MQPLPASADDRIVWDTWLAVYRLPVVMVADEVGTFRALADRAQTTAELAQGLQLDARSLGIHLGLLAALGFVDRSEGRWRCTAAALTWMHPDAEGYCAPVLRLFHRTQPLHAQLLATLRPQTQADAHVSSTAEWERGEMPAALARNITEYMNAANRAAALSVARQRLFSRVPTVLDIGGGSAVFSIELAKAWPDLRATVLEIPAVCVEAERYIAAAGVGARVCTASCNMFTQSWPTGHALHFLSNIFHDWSDDTCRMLARRSFESLPTGGQIVVHEMLMDDDGCGPLPAAAFSMLMMLSTKGRQYSLPELREFLESAGFVDVEATATGGGYFSIVIARKP